MHNSRNIVLLTCAAIALVGCARSQPPPSEVLATGMVDALIDTGFYSEVSISRVIGQHYNSAENAWKIFACYQFTLADGAEGSNCVDSISALKLENGTWIIAVTINEVYRWRAVSLIPQPGQSQSIPTRPAQ